MTSQKGKDVSELLPCPCCGYRAEIEQVPHNPETPNSGGYYIECKRAGCGITTRLIFACKDDPLPELIQSWNRRAAPETRASEPTSVQTTHDLLKAVVELFEKYDLPGMAVCTEDCLDGIPDEPLTNAARQEPVSVSAGAQGEGAVSRLPSGEPLSPPTAIASPAGAAPDTPTPRTEAEFFTVERGPLAHYVVSAAFARRLERELAMEQAENEVLREQNFAMNKSLAEARAALEEFVRIDEDCGGLFANENSTPDLIAALNDAHIVLAASREKK